MAQVILIEPNKNLADILSLNLKTYVGANVIEKNSVEETVELLKLLPDIDLIITRSIVNEQKSGEIIQNHLIENESEAGLLITGHVDFVLGLNSINIPDHLDWEKVVKSSAKMLNVSPELLEKKVRPNYIPIPIGHFSSISSTSCDVFIRIKRSADEFQFVKRIHGGDSFSQAAINKYKSQGLQNLYIKKEDLIPFTNHLSDQLVQRLEETPTSIDTHMVVISESLKIALHEIKKLGFNSATLQLSEAIIDNFFKLNKDEGQLSNLLKKIINSKTNYLYQHAHMTTLISGEMLKQMNLNQKPSQELMAHASLFKDIYLADHPELAKISTFSELEDAHLEDEDWDLVFNHAFDASILVLKNNQAPKGLDRVIKTHHGTQNGKGFSYSHVEDLSTMEQIFIISCEFVRNLLEYKEKGGTPQPVIKNLYNKFQGDNITEVIKSLEKVLLEIKNKAS